MQSIRTSISRHYPEYYWRKRLKKQIYFPPNWVKSFEKEDLDFSAVVEMKH